MTDGAILEAGERARSYLDHALDLDGHEFTPPHLWGSVFGPAGARLADICSPFLSKLGEGYAVMPDLEGDNMAMNVQNVWNVRTAASPGSFDMHRRLEAMDLMGVKRQIIFPSFGVMAMIFATTGQGGGAQVNVREAMLGGIPPEEAREVGLAGIRAYNEWAIRSAAIDPDRLRVVGMLMPPTSIEALVEQAQSLIDSGIKVLLIGHGSPLANTSPAHPALDPFWNLLASNDIVLTAHLGGDLGFLSASEWGSAPAFSSDGKLSAEIGLDPYSYSSFQFSISHWIAVLVMGGVFERHPQLRFAAVELGAHWFGPLSEWLDMWAEKVFARRLAPFLSMKPSAYMARNIRITPFNIAEPIDTFFERYPNLADCYCFSTDYPHVEGGKNIKEKMRDLLAPLGADILEKYFVKNAEFVFPSIDKS